MADIEFEQMEDEHHWEDEWCGFCEGTHWIPCGCGDDVCVCEQNGEQPCPKCNY